MSSDRFDLGYAAGYKDGHAAGEQDGYRVGHAFGVSEGTGLACDQVHDLVRDKAQMASMLRRCWEFCDDLLSGEADLPRDTEKMEFAILSELGRHGFLGGATEKLWRELAAEQNSED